jgi:hypothetical protein
MDDETEFHDEQMRLMLGWRAVLSDIGDSEAGAGRW